MAGSLPVGVLLSCGPLVIAPEARESESGGGTTTTNSSGPMTENPSGTTLGSDSGESSTTEAAPVGPGCDPAPACDRGTYPDSVSVSSVDEIQQIAGYTALAGSLLIRDSEFICLDFLLCLTSVGLSVNFYDNKRLRDLSGTDAIVEVGALDEERSIVYLSNNDEIATLDGFASLPRLRKLTIQDHAVAERITGFGALEHVEAELYFLSNPVLFDLGRVGELEGPSETCWMANNPKLCQSNAEAVCGVGETVNDNDDAC